MDAPARHPPCLIVNADDFGYFRCVSRGIIKAAAAGIVTATGVLANGEDFVEQAAWLRDQEHLDAGVHLNATYGAPLSEGLRRRLAGSGGRFGGKLATATAILTRTIAVDDIEREWRAQIERCVDQGIVLRFINSHEHIHMLPSLFPVAQALALDYGIEHVRYPTAERPRGLAAGPMFRATMMGVLGAANRRRLSAPVPRFVGLESSGRLHEADIERLAAGLRAGEVVELMCHPGEFDPTEVRDPRLLAYHDWTGELQALTSGRIRNALDRLGVRLVGYRDLAIRRGRLVPTVAAAGA